MDRDLNNAHVTGIAGYRLWPCREIVTPEPGLDGNHPDARGAEHDLVRAALDQGLGLPRRVKVIRDRELARHGAKHAVGLFGRLKRHQPGYRFAGARDYDLFALCRSVHQARKVGFCSMDVDSRHAASPTQLSLS